MNLTIYAVVMVIFDVWKFGAYTGWKLLGVLILLLSTGQLLWQFWRWIDDAEKREDGNGNMDHDKDGYINKYERHRILYGNLFNSWPWEIAKGETVAWWGIFIVVSGIIAAVAIAFWPILIAAAIIYGLGRVARGSRRLQKTIAKIVESLKEKADKTHNHVKRQKKTA